jgi:hypothetical protein
MLKTLNPARLVVAAHELGHGLIWKAADFPVGSLWIRGESDDWMRGATEMGGNLIRDTEHMAEYLVGLLAGHIAGERWRDEYRVRERMHGNVGDEATYRQMMRADMSQPLRRADLTLTAQRAVSVHWGEIERLAPLLAERGTLRL